MIDASLIAKLKAQADLLHAQGVAHLALFGSRARGDGAFDSDLDLIVDVRADRKFSLLDLIGVENMISDLTGVEAHALMRRSLRQDFVRRIQDDIVEIF